MRNTLLFPEEMSRISQPSSRGDMAGKLCTMLSDKKIEAGQFELNKPWGIEFKVREDFSDLFLNSFFDVEMVLSPALRRSLVNKAFGSKILAIEPEKDMSWNEKDRKDAFVRVLSGQLNVNAGSNEQQEEPIVAEAGELIHIPELIRHKLGSVAGWSVLAEISENVVSRG